MFETHMKDTKFFYSLFKALLKEPRQAMLFGLGVFLLIFGLFASTPSPSELELFSGELKSAVVMQDCSGKCRTEVVITIGPTYRRFWNDAVKKSSRTNNDRIGAFDCFKSFGIGACRGLQPDACNWARAIFSGADEFFTLERFAVFELRV